jgi:hypothetical protein
MADISTMTARMGKYLSLLTLLSVIGLRQWACATQERQGAIQAPPQTDLNRWTVEQQPRTPAPDPAFIEPDRSAGP